MWIIGVDGGGTKCEAGLFDPTGQLVATAISGAANVFADFEGAIASIEQASEQLIASYNALAQANQNTTISKKDCFLSLGCAGGGIESAKNTFQQWQHSYAGAVLNTDLHVACLAANNTKACALFVIGTGSCLAVLENNQMRQLGGHGFLLGDNASGAWLGKKAVSWYLQALETPNADKDLQDALALILGNNINDIIDQYGQASSGKFGLLVPVILQVKQQSLTVQNWFNEGAQYAAELLLRHVRSDLPIFLAGGLAIVYQPLIEEMSRKSIRIPNNNAVYGAYSAGKYYLEFT